MVDPLIYFLLIFKSSLFSTGGPGGLPILFQDLVSQGWASESQFAQALAIGQLSPGPNGLWMVSLGYLNLGLLGAILAMVAISISPFAVLGLNALHRQIQGQPQVRGFMRGVALSVLGLTLVVALSLLAAPGLDWKAWLIAFGSMGLTATRRLPVWLVLLLGAGAGYLCYGLVQG